jgi:hypothetical protein
LRAYHILFIPDNEQQNATLYLFPVLIHIPQLFSIFKHPFYLSNFCKIALILFLVPNLFFGQEETPGINVKRDNARFVIKMVAGIPKPITSSLFRKSFNGFYDMGISGNFRTVGNVYFGIGYQNIFFKNNSYLKQQVFNASIPYDTRLLSDCPFVVLSYDKFLKERSYVSYGIHYGYIIARYTNINFDTSLANKPFVARDFAAQYIKPEVSFNFIDSDNPWVSFAVSIAYTTVLYKYDPKAPHFNHFEIEDANGRAYPNRYYMSWLTVGFGVNVLLGRSKE